jgi:Retinoic acid induced 16-like protein
VQRLNSLLDEESKKTAPYSCLLHAASTQIYIIVTKLALSSQDAGVISGAARFFHVLINGEVEGVLDSKLFARSLVDLVKRTIGTKIITLSEQEEGDLVELLFGITTKIRLDPDILSAWFYPSLSRDTTEQAGAKVTEFAGATRRTDFPLFYLLIDCVYHDGRTGDFARTGLLYLTDTASKSKELEKWMIESDLATLMASGLGALYSRLSRRLPSIGHREELPPILALSDYKSDSDATPASIESLRNDMNAFLSYLLFWQDTLNHCQSDEVKDTLLDHFQVLFLQQLLYPSLLESSDIDEGSTASVIMYLYQILESLDNPDLVGRILKYLLASKDQAINRTRARKQRMSLSRRKSFDALTALAQARDNPSPDLFNLLDLVMMSLKSKHPQTVAAALKLITVILQRHHRFAWASFIHTRIEDAQLPMRKVPELNEHLRHLMSLAPVVLDDGLTDQSYGEILKDVLSSLETHNCSAYLSQDENLDNAQEKRVAIVEDDLLVNQINSLLTSFFANDTMTNLALTEAIISIASCRLTVLDGWLLPRPTQSLRSTIISTLEGLVEQVRHWRHQTLEWDSLMTLQKSNLDEFPPEDPETESRSARLQLSTDPDPPSSTSNLSRQLIEVSSPTPGLRGRRSPRTLYSEAFGSIDSSVTSSPSPTDRLQKPSHLGSPLRQNLFLPPPNSSSSPTSRTTSRSTSNNPDPLQSRLVLPSPPHSSTPVHMSGITTVLDHALQRDHDSLVSENASHSGIGMGTPSERGVNDGDDASLSPGTVSLSHVLVNAVVLREFILEIAAVLQVRACVWGDVEV